MRKLIAMLSIAVMAFAGGSMFASADTVAVDKYYVSTDSPLIWEETNGCAGLQTTASDCDGNAANGAEAADDQIA